MNFITHNDSLHIDRIHPHDSNGLWSWVGVVAHWQLRQHPSSSSEKKLPPRRRHRRLHLATRTRFYLCRLPSCSVIFCHAKLKLGIFGGRQADDELHQPIDSGRSPTSAVDSVKRTQFTYRGNHKQPLSTSHYLIASDKPPAHQPLPLPPCRHHQLSGRGSSHREHRLPPKRRHPHLQPRRSRNRSLASAPMRSWRNAQRLSPKPISTNRTRRKGCFS